MLVDIRRRGRGVAAAAALAAGLCPGVSSGQARQWHALPVAGGTDVLAASAGLEPGLPGWRVFYESAERRHGLWGEDAGTAAASAASKEAATQVPLPLAPNAWRRILGRGGVLDEQLAPVILADRRASLLYRGLAALDEPTLAALAAEPKVLRRIYRRHADAFAAFGGRFEVRDGAVVVPGGSKASPLWEDLVGESPGAPARFLQELLAANGGRRAFFFDSVARLDPARQRFALGMDEPPDPKPGAAFLAMAAVFDREAAWWKGEGGAFARPDADVARLLRDVRLREDRSLAPPAAQAFWEAVFSGANPASRATWAREIRSSPPAGAAWLAEKIGTGGAAVRRLRFEQLAFAQRVFGEAGEDELPGVLLAVRALRDARSAVLALERLGTRDPSLYAAGAAAARRAGAAGGATRHLALGGLQGALGVIDRSRFARTLDVAASERLARSLFALPFDEKGGRDRSLASWVETALLPELARAVPAGGLPGEPEATVLRAMAGDRAFDAEGSGPFAWEGLWYRADPGRSELARMERIRARQGGAGLAEALRACQSPAVKRQDPCAEALGPALVSLVYAAHLGEPDGPALAGEDPSRRHDFGPEPWALPEEVSGPGVPWHVRGSLLGLERALARLALHRLEGDALPDAPPVVDAPQRRSLAVPAALANPRDLDDAGRDAIADAIESGRRRVASLLKGDAGLEPVCRDAGLDPWRARALEWLLEHEPADRDSFFSLGELLHLGAPRGGRWDAWGVADDLAWGLCLRLPGPRPLDEAWGRRPEAAVEESFVDVGLRVAVHLSERRLPASLGGALLATLLPDLFAEARPVAPDDRLGLDAWVRALPRDRLDDAVASLAGRGPLQPSAGTGEAR